MQSKFAHFLLPALLGALAPAVKAQPLLPYYYNTGSPAGLREIWVDPTNGNDSNTGATRAAALKSVGAAIAKIPSNTILATGYHVKITRGTDLNRFRPHSLKGTQQKPIIFESVDGPSAATIRNYGWIYDSSYVYVIGLRIQTAKSVSPYNVLHVSSSHHILLKNVNLSGYGTLSNNNVPREGLKVNQSQYIYLEGADISNVTDNPVDYVAVQYGHVVDCKLHDSKFYLMYAKGGSAQLRIEGNTFYNNPAGGFAAGFSTGFEFMIAPWIHYEAYDIKFLNNTLRDIDGFGMAAIGGYNIEFAGNTMERVGITAAPLRFSLGERTCDGNTTLCTANWTAGGWGPRTSGSRVLIPNKNVYVFNNILYNPPTGENGVRHLRVDPPMAVQPGSNLPGIALTDDNVRIEGNVLYQGPGTILGIEPTGNGCLPTNPTCNAVQLRADNWIDTLRPEMVRNAANELLPLRGGNLFPLGWRPVPVFPSNVSGLTPTPPVGNLANGVMYDKARVQRTRALPKGAYVTGITGTIVNIAERPEPDPVEEPEP